MYVYIIYVHIYNICIRLVNESFKVKYNLRSSVTST